MIAAFIKLLTVIVILGFIAAFLQSPSEKFKKDYAECLEIQKVNPRVTCDDL